MKLCCLHTGIIHALIAGWALAFFAFFSNLTTQSLSTISLIQSFFLTSFAICTASHPAMLKEFKTGKRFSELSILDIAMELLVAGLVVLGQMFYVHSCRLLNIGDASAICSCVQFVISLFLETLLMRKFPPWETIVSIIGCILGILTIIQPPILFNDTILPHFLMDTISTSDVANRSQSISGLFFNIVFGVICGIYVILVFTKRMRSLSINYFMGSLGLANFVHWISVWLWTTVITPQHQSADCTASVSSCVSRVSDRAYACLTAFFIACAGPLVMTSTNSTSPTIGAVLRISCILYSYLLQLLLSSASNWLQYFGAGCIFGAIIFQSICIEVKRRRLT